MRNFLLILITILFLSCMVIAEAKGQTQDEIENSIVRLSRRHNMDPALMLAIAKTESKLNPKAVGSKGELGVFQLRPEFHKFNANSIDSQVNVAIVYLSTIRRKWEPVYGNAWFISFNLGPNYRRINHPSLFPYYKRVMASKLERQIANN